MMDDHHALATNTAPAVLWPRVREALVDPRFELRSVSGLSRDLNISDWAVRRVVAAHRDELRFSSVRAEDGGSLFTLAEHPKSWRERLSEIRFIAASLA
jgi:hypothetical protein